MFDELVKRLRAICPEDYSHPMDFAYGVQQVMHEAAAVIEELSKQNKKWEEVVKIALDFIPHWIPVEEQLPNVDTNKSGYETTTVLVTVQGWKNARPLVYQRACIRGKTVYRWKWEWGTIYDGPPITHWMPLPKPSESPKEEDNDV